MNKFKVVKIEWIDAVAIGEWKSIKDLENDEHADTAPCTTIGYLIRTTKTLFYVASTITTISGDLIANGIMAIPRKWVKSKVELDIGEEE